MASAGVNINVIASVEQAQRALQGVQRDLERLGKGAQSADAKMRASATRMADVGRKLTTRVSLPIAAGFGLAVKAASDLDEALNANSVTFGSNADAAEEWARGLARSAGLAASEGLQAAAGFGAMLRTGGLAAEEAERMSRELVQLAGDMGSLRNVDPSEMLDKIRSGLAGEVEPLRRFGVSLSAAAVNAKALELGLADANGEVTDAARFQARYAILMEQTTDAQGDFVRTADSVANGARIVAAESKNAAASFGEVLLPITKELIKVATGLAKAFDALPQPVKTAVAAMLGIAAVAGPIVFLIGEVRLLSLELKKTRVEGIATSGALRGLAGALGPLSIAAAGVAAGFAHANAEKLKNRDLIQTKLVPAFVQGRMSLEEFNRAIDFFTKFGQASREEIDAWVAEARKQEVAANDAGAAVDGMGNKIAETGNAAKSAGEDLAGFASMTKEEFKDWRASVTESLDPVQNALSELGGDAKLTARKVEQAFRQQIRAANDLQENLATAERRGLPDKLAQQLLDMGQEGADILAVLADANKRQFNRIVETFRKAQREARETQSAINGLKNKTVEVDVEINADKLRAFADSKMGKLLNFDIPFFARGGLVDSVPLGQPTLAVVHGGERVLTPQQQRTREMPASGGGGTTINITLNGSGISRQDVDLLTREIGRRIDLVRRT